MLGTIDEYRAKLTDAKRALTKKQPDFAAAFELLESIRNPEGVEEKATGAEAPTQYKDLCLLVDSSGSIMNYFKEICEAGRNALHLAFEEDGADCSVVNYSNDTLSTGWQDKHGGNDLVKTLCVSQGAGTNLNPRTVRELMEQAKGNFAAIMVTDGEFCNTHEALDALREMVEAGNKLGIVYIHDHPSGAYLDELAEFADLITYRNPSQGYIKTAVDHLARHFLKGEKMPACYNQRASKKDELRVEIHEEGVIIGGRTILYSPGFTAEVDEIMSTLFPNGTTVTVYDNISNEQMRLPLKDLHTHPHVSQMITRRQ